jgi:hypothetical protein
MKYSDWTDEEWNQLIKAARREPIKLTDAQIREAAWGYMHSGADDGGNRFGLEGTIVALCVDAI